jgi:L-ascorbate metabolism protein UlaG (beta-lactamase superfamily)
MGKFFSADGSYHESDHYDGKRFFCAGTDQNWKDIAKWVWNMKTVKWPQWITDPVYPSPDTRVVDGIHITYINHATVLIQIDGINILTDPIWSKRCGPYGIIGSARIRKPGIAFENLPKIDFVLISHNHYDHCDLPTLQKINHRDSPHFITGLGIGKLLHGAGISAVSELDWNDSRSAGANVTVSFVPAKHFSGRTPFDRNATLWGGFFIQGRSGTVYFAGDTAFGDHFKEIRLKYGSPDISILPIGNYEARWFMKNIHINPEDAVNAHRVLGSAKSIAMHFGTFAEHPEQEYDAHERDLSDELAKYNTDKPDFIIPGFGQTVTYNRGKK